MTLLRSRTVVVPSTTKDRTECEDAFATNSQFGRAAVADGATWSVRSGQWAALLSESFCTSLPELATERVIDWADGLSAQMATTLQEHADSDSAGWWSEEAAARGSAAAFVGVELSRSEGDGMTFHAIAVGDCCLFHVRRGRVLRSWPLTSVDEFNSSPTLIESTNTIQPDHVHHLRGEARAGDYLILASDAVAQWLLGLVDAEPDRVRTVIGIAQAPWQDLVDWLRARNAIVDDDSTLMTIQIVGTDQS